MKCKGLEYLFSYILIVWETRFWLAVLQEYSTLYYGSGFDFERITGPFLMDIEWSPNNAVKFFLCTL